MRKITKILVGIFIVTLFFSICFINKQISNADSLLEFTKFAGTGCSVDEMVISKNEEDLTHSKGITIPAGSVLLDCAKNTNSVKNIFYTTSKLDLTTTTIIKWVENISGDMTSYHLGFASTVDKLKEAKGELDFYEQWGSAITIGQNQAGTLKSTIYSNGISTGNVWDFGDGSTAQTTPGYTINRDVYYFYQIKIEWNESTSKYDITMTSEGHNGSHQEVRTTYSISMSKLTSGMYFYFYGNSYTGGKQSSIYLLNDERSGHISGTTFVKSSDQSQGTVDVVAFKKLSANEDTSEMVVTKYTEDYALNKYMTIPAESVLLSCGTSQNSIKNVFYTGKVVDLTTSATIKWVENFTGDMTSYHIGLASTLAKAKDGNGEIDFYEQWGSQVYSESEGKNIGTMKTTIFSNGTSTGKVWDFGDGSSSVSTQNYTLKRQVYYYYQIEIKWNSTTSKYDITMSSESHSGSNKVTRTTYSLDLANITTGMYFYFSGNSYTGGKQSSIILLKDSRSGRLPGTDFANWKDFGTESDDNQGENPGGNPQENPTKNFSFVTFSKNSTSTTEGMTYEVYEEDVAINKYVTAPAGTVLLNCDTSENSNINTFYTARTIDMTKPVYIKWNENLTAGDMAQYHIGLASNISLVQSVSGEIDFCQEWGTVFYSQEAQRDRGTLRSTIYSRGVKTKNYWDFGISSNAVSEDNYLLDRSKYYYYQIKIEWNENDECYDVSMSSEAHNGLHQVTRVTYKIYINKITTGAYLYFSGQSRKDGKQSSIYLIHDNRNGRLKGINYEDWADYSAVQEPEVDMTSTKTVTVTNVQEFMAAFNDSEVGYINCLPNPNLKHIQGNLTLTRSLTIDCGYDSSGNVYGGENGLILDGIFTVQGKKVNYTMIGGAASFVVDGATCDFLAVGMGTNFQETKTDYSIKIINGGKVNSSWSSFTYGKYAAVYLAGSSYFSEEQLAQTMYQMKAYGEINNLPSKYKDSNGLARVYCVMEGSGNSFVGFNDCALKQEIVGTTTYYVKMPISVVTTIDEFMTAFNNSEVDEINVITNGISLLIEGELELTRSLKINSMYSDGSRANGEAGIIFVDTITVKGPNVTLSMDGGCGNFIFDNANGNFVFVGMGYNKIRPLEEGYHDHCIILKNGSSVISTVGALSESRAGAIRLENGSTFEETTREDVYTPASEVSVEVHYIDLFPEYYYNSSTKIIRLYAVMVGGNNKLSGVFDSVDLSYWTDETTGITYAIEYTPMRGFAFDKTSLTVSVDGRITTSLVETSPEEPTSFLFEYSIENSELAEVVSINQGLGCRVIGKKAGNTRLIIRTCDRNDGTFVQREIPIYVTNAVINSISIDTSNVKQKLEKGEALNLNNLVVIVKYSDNTQRVLYEDEYSIDKGGFNRVKEGSYTIEVTYGNCDKVSFVVVVGNEESESKGCGSTIGSELLIVLVLCALCVVRRKKYEKYE